MYDSILVATDGSEAATTAVEHATALAGRFDAQLYGIAVVDERTAYDSGIVDPEEAERHRRERATAWLEELEATAAATDPAVSVETTVRSGVPHEEIIDYAAECDAGAIVVGARGRSSFKGALLGSTVERVVRAADRPVLVVGGTGESAEETAGRSSGDASSGQ
ncbi:universal stress protein [Natrinema salifodinae]|uniref:Nucleotide-binding universal stress protein, UspA family n=1 Tax=Natrinema salifodinae TaxID=1202768 RepID=A0A1I0N901_9EURY|nr:universal stress protein [Natrinema salifodinae]SEV97566.1 Nucleotide-binding universal stress protein, UspA family [Natrinema salifodinae]